MAVESEKPVHIIKSISVYIDDDKIADITSGTYKLNSNRDAQHTDGGYTGHTSGSLLATMDIKTIVGVSTQSFGRLHQKVLDGGYLKVVIPVEGSLVSYVGVIKDMSLDWDHSKGSAGGGATFEGGRVQQQGGG